MSSRLDWLDAAVAKLRHEHLLRDLRVRETPQSASIRINGRELVNFSSNDYLGLATDPRLCDAVRQTLDAAGWGAGASPLVTGRSRHHAELERALASFEGSEAALLFPSGFAANAGTIPALVGQGDVVLSDRKNHASIIDGCRLAAADIRIYEHVDMDSLARHLSDSVDARRRMIVTDGLFSMDGDLAPLDKICDLADQFDAMVFVDEAHATGVFGPNGRGTCELMEVESRVDVRVGTLSKGLGTIGGFVTGQQILIEWLSNRARSYVFSTASPPATCAAGLEALRIVAEQPYRREQLLARAHDLRERLIDDGWDVGGSSSQIIPIVLHDASRAMDVSRALRERGFCVPGIRPPTVPEGASQLRISLSFAHAPEQIDRLVDALRSCRGFARP